jgi:hypothetical protein
MPKEEIALISPLLVITGIGIPVLLSKYTTGPRPLNVFIKAFIPRLIVGLLYGALLPFARLAYTIPGLASTTFRMYFVLCVILREVTTNAMFVAQMVSALCEGVDEASSLMVQLSEYDHDRHHHLIHLPPPFSSSSLVLTC